MHSLRFKNLNLNTFTPTLSFVCADVALASAVFFLLMMSGSLYYVQKHLTLLMRVMTVICYSHLSVDEINRSHFAITTLHQ